MSKFRNIVAKHSRFAGRAGAHRDAKNDYQRSGKRSVVRESLIAEDYYGDEGDRVYIDTIGYGEHKAVVLINADTLIVIDKRFPTPEAAGRYAAGRGLVLVSREEAEAQFESTGPNTSTESPFPSLREHIRRRREAAERQLEEQARQLVEGRTRELSMLYDELEAMSDQQLIARLKKNGIDNKQYFDGAHKNRKSAIDHIVAVELDAIKRRGVAEDAMGSSFDPMQAAISVAALHGCEEQNGTLSCELRPDVTFDGAVSKIAQHFGVEPQRRGPIVSLDNPKGRGKILLKQLGAKRVALRRG